jgi:hypothetical protein
MEEKGPTVWVSLGMTVNLGNFENQKLDVGLAGIPADASPEYLEKVLGEAGKTIDTIMEGLGQQLVAKVQAIKN